MLIERLTDINKLWEIQQDFEKSNNIKLLNVSNWNCCSEYRNCLLDVFKAPHSNNYVDYMYSYSLSNTKIKQIKERYPFLLKQNKEFMITPNNTVSILYIINFLKQIRIKKVCIIAPTYFAVYNTLDLLNIKYDIIRLQHEQNSFFIKTNIDFTQYDAIWVTSPIFCSGLPIDNTAIKIIENFSQDKIVVTDESFCKYGEELPNKYKLKRHIGIYSPHKSIGLNSFKFSLITLNADYMDIFEHWSDVLCGSLNITNYNAISHFLTDNYSDCQNACTKFIENACTLTKEVIKSNPNLSIDTAATGNMIMVYATNIPYSKMNDIEFFKTLIKNTQGSIIPGYLHDYVEDYGFCFRVNLSLFNNHFLNILKNICMFLK